MNATKPRVVAVGGGHGLALSLHAAQSYAAHLTALVATSDDGGSSGRLRASTGMAAPGDLRRCLTTMASDPIVAQCFEHRFEDGELAGHPVGNLLLAGLVESGLGLDEATRRVSVWLGIDPDLVVVLPVTPEPVDLVARTTAGMVRGQVEVKNTPDIVGVCVDPPEPAVAAAVTDALAAADQIVLGPGSLYTSVLAAAAVPSVRDAIERARAHTVYVCNLRSDEVEAKDYSVADHVDALRRHGIVPDTVVVQRDSIPIGDLGSVRVVIADVDRPHRLAHDASLLGAVLAELF